MLNVSQWSNHCGPTRISTCKQGEDKDWQLKCLGAKPSFLVKGRVEWESSRSSYAISYLLPSQAEPVLLSEQNVRARGISTEICVKSREKSGGFPTPPSSFLNPKHHPSLCCGKHFWSLLPPSVFLCSFAWSPNRGKEKAFRNI